MNMYRRGCLSFLFAEFYIKLTAVNLNKTVYLMILRELFWSQSSLSLSIT